MHEDHFELQGHKAISAYIKNGLNFCAFIMIKDEPLERKSFCKAVTRAGSLTAAPTGEALCGLRVALGPARVTPLTHGMENGIRQ